MLGARTKLRGASWGSVQESTLCASVRPCDLAAGALSPPVGGGGGSAAAEISPTPDFAPWISQGRHGISRAFLLGPLSVAVNECADGTR